MQVATERGKKKSAKFLRELLQGKACPAGHRLAPYESAGGKCDGCGAHTAAGKQVQRLSGQPIRTVFAMCRPRICLCGNQGAHFISKEETQFVFVFETRCHSTGYGLPAVQLVHLCSSREWRTSSAFSATPRAALRSVVAMSARRGFVAMCSTDGEKYARPESTVARSASAKAWLPEAPPWKPAQDLNRLSGGRRWAMIPCARRVIVPWNAATKAWNRRSLSRSRTESASSGDSRCAPVPSPK